MTDTNQSHRRTLRAMLEALPADARTDGTLLIRPIQDDYDLWFATVSCKLKGGQEDLVNPAGFSIGRAYLAPDDNYPCIVCKSDGTKIGYIVFRKWSGTDRLMASWSYFLSAEYQGLGLGRRAAMLAVHILKAAGLREIRLSTEAENKRAQRLYRSIGFQMLDETDGDDLVFGITLNKEKESWKNSF